MWTNWEEKVDPNATIPSRLLWDVDLNNFDWEKGKNIVVERVIEQGMPEDFYTLFRMYGGVEGVREIAKNIKHFRWKQDIAFTCMIFDIKKEDMACYKRQQLREALLNS
jgi:16S rRNA C1402 N4-methylase RsmH